VDVVVVNTSGRAVSRAVACMVLVVSGLSLPVVLAVADPAGPTSSVRDAAPGDPTKLPLLGEEDGRAMPSAPVTAPEKSNGDFSNAPGTTGRQTSSFDPSTSREDVELASPTRRVFTNSDGTKTVQVSSRPRRFQAEDGTWHDIDNTLVRKGAKLVPAASSSGLEIAADGADLVTIPLAGGRLSMRSPEGFKGNGRAHASGRSVTIDGEDGLRTSIAATGDGFEQSLVVSSSSAPSSYRISFVLPNGVSARSGGPGIEFVDATGQVIATFGGGFAFDSGELSTGVPVTTALRSTRGAVAVADVFVDAAWFQDPARVLPITIDPSFSQFGASDTFVRKTFGSQWGTSYLQSGTADGGTTAARSLLKFNGLPAVSPTNGVTDAHVSIYTNWGMSCSARPLQVLGLAEGFDASTTWTNQPAVDAFGVVSTTWFNKGNNGSCPAGYQDLDVTALAQRWLDGTQTNQGLQLRAENETDSASWKRFASSEDSLNAPWLFITYQDVPPAPTLAAPADGATLLTTTPTLAVNPVTDPPPASSQPRYWFRLWTSADTPEAGQQIDSGWLLGANSWTVPTGALVDGVTYSWTAFADDGSGAHVARKYTRTFTVNTRSGRGASDTEGPISVDLGTGSGAMVVKTAGGVSFTYNTLDRNAMGLTGTYYKDLNSNATADNDEKVGTHVDPMLAFNWGDSSPNPAIPDDRYLVKWTGAITTPYTGSLTFAASHDDRVKITINGTVVLDRWSAGSVSSTPDAGNAISLTAGVPVPITVEYYENTGPAFLTLWMADPVTPNTYLPVLPSWLTPWTGSQTVSHMGVLPVGWSMNLPGTTWLAYTGAEVSNDHVLIKTSWGSAVAYKRTAGGGWQAPMGDPSTLVTEPDGTLTLTSQGYVYRFRADGLLDSATSNFNADGTDTAAVYNYINVTTSNGVVPRLGSVTDPVANRTTTLTYKSGGNCPTYYTAPPEGMLCRINHWDGTGTDVLYFGGQVARIQTGASMIHDFWYSAANGKLSDVRDPLAADAVAAGANPGGLGSRWLVSYDTSTPPRITRVRGPEPTPGTARPGHTYVYAPSMVDVKLDGQSTALGYAIRYEFDDNGHLLRQRDAMGRTMENNWDPTQNRIRWVDSPADGNGVKLRTTHLFDSLGRLTDVYGPAPSTWFDQNTGLPTGGHSSQDIPHERTRYDEGFNGLESVWYENADLTGKAKKFDTSVGNPNGTIDANWGSGAPAGVAPSDNWSVRLTGYITFNASGFFQLRLQRDGRARVFVANSQVMSDWNESATALTAQVDAVIPGTQMPILIEYADTSGPASLKLEWSANGGAWQTVPAAQLAPNYGLQTSGTTADTSAVDENRQTSRIGYNNGHLGQPVSTTVDPSQAGYTGLGLTSVVDYEPSGQRRVTTRTLPAGNRSIYSYYGAAETADNPCTAGTVEAFNQSGALKLTTSPTPASGPALQHEVRYDDAGRVVADRWNNEPWTCSTFDARGRLTQRSVPAFGNEAARTATYNYAVGGNPLITSASDATGTITATHDLLGRVTQVVDVWGKTSTTVYDQAGRVAQTTGPEGTRTVTYDDSGAITAVTLNGAVVATTQYDPTTGRPLGYAYPSGAGNGGNGTSSRGINADGSLAADLQVEAHGRSTGVAWVQPDGTTVITSDQITNRTIGGRLLDRKIDGVDPNPAGENYQYDAAGRLTMGYSDAGVRWDYAFAATSSCSTPGANNAAGKNTNRTSAVTAAGTTNYCYDMADRLLSYGTPAVTMQYDAHGNVTSHGAETRTYDGDNRHLSTTNGSTTVRYRRNVLGDIVERTENGVVVARYSGSATIDVGGIVIESSIPLPGGVLLTKRASGDSWSYPNSRGDLVAKANVAGAKVGTTVKFDPYGNSTGVLDNMAGNFDAGWTGRRFTEHAPGLVGDRIEMGAREYLPALGRFNGVDPLTGGSANDYEYCNGDPINCNDLNGTWSSTWQDDKGWHFVSQENNVLLEVLIGEWEPTIWCDWICGYSMDWSEDNGWVCGAAVAGLCLRHRGYQVRKNTLSVRVFFTGADGLRDEISIKIQTQFYRNIYDTCAAVGIKIWGVGYTKCTPIKRQMLTDGEVWWYTSVTIGIRGMLIMTYCDDSMRRGCPDGPVPGDRLSPWQWGEH